MLESNLKLNALAWKAKEAGQSYGVFCTPLSEAEKEQIYLEYEQMRENQREDERMRLELARGKQIELKRMNKNLKFMDYESKKK